MLPVANSLLPKQLQETLDYCHDSGVSGQLVHGILQSALLILGHTRCFLDSFAQFFQKMDSVNLNGNSGISCSDSRAIEISGHVYSADRISCQGVVGIHSSETLFGETCPQLRDAQFGVNFNVPRLVEHQHISPQPIAIPPLLLSQRGEITILEVVAHGAVVFQEMENLQKGFML